MRGHKSFDLHVLLLIEQLLHNLKVTFLWISHQNKVSCQALLHRTLGVLANSLEVGANLDRRTDFPLIYSHSLSHSICRSYTMQKKAKDIIDVNQDDSYFFCDKHAPESLNGRELHGQSGSRLSHALQQDALGSRASGLHCFSHVTNNLDGISQIRLSFLFLCGFFHVFNLCLELVTYPQGQEGQVFLP